MKKLILILAIAFIAAVIVRVVMQKTGQRSAALDDTEVQVIET